MSNGRLPVRIRPQLGHPRVFRFGNTKTVQSGHNTRGRIGAGGGGARNDSKAKSSYDICPTNTRFTTKMNNKS
jgi:hypothetical protein